MSVKSLKKIIDQLNNGSEKKKLHAIEKLSSLNTAASIEALVLSLINNDITIKRHIFNVLEHMDGDVVNGIIKKYENSLYEAFVKDLNNKEWSVRSFAVKFLGRMSGKNAISPLLAMLNDREGYVRYFAAETIGKFCHVSAIPSLADSLMDEYGYVRTYISEAIINILENSPEDSSPHEVILLEETLKDVKKRNNPDTAELIKILDKKIKDIRNNIKDFVIIPDNYPGNRDFVIIEYNGKDLIYG